MVRSRLGPCVDLSATTTLFSYCSKGACGSVFVLTFFLMYRTFEVHFRVFHRCLQSRTHTHIHTHDYNTTKLVSEARTCCLLLQRIPLLSAMLNNSFKPYLNLLVSILFRFFSLCVNGFPLDSCTNANRRQKKKPVTEHGKDRRQLHTQAHTLTHTHGRRRADLFTELNIAAAICKRVARSR